MTDARPVTRLKRAMAYAVLSAAVIGIAALIFQLVFPAPEARAAIRFAGALAFVVQNVAFAIAVRMAPAHAIAGWGIGAMMALATVVIFAFVADARALPLEPALISLATYLFVTDVFEPLLLPTR